MPKRHCCNYLTSTRLSPARQHDDAAAWLAEHDGARIAAEREAKRAEAKRQDEGKRAGRKAATFLTVL